jgi:hemolysin activation/secretion protein
MPATPRHFAPRHRQALAACAASILLAAPASGHAQTSPGVADTQELLRQQERERQLREQFERAPDVRLEAPAAASADAPLAVDETPCFRIERIELAGAGGEAFHWALAAIDRPDDPPTGRCLGTRAINQIMTRLQNRIVSRGYITTRVVAAAQDLTRGVLTLTVIPGRIRDIRPADGTQLHARLGAALPAASGDLLNLRDIEQGLENLKRVPTADADIQIAPAADPLAGPGESDLVVAWRQERLLRLNLSLDDSGTRATGRFLGGATVSLDNALGLSDLFYASFNHDLGGGVSGSRGTHGYTVHYALPWGYWLASLTAGGNTYHQAVAGANQTYRYSGESEHAALRLTRLLHRNATGKTSAWVQAWMRQSSNFIDDTEVVVQRRRMGGWEAGFNHRAFIAAATLDVDLAYRRGTGAFAALRAPEENFGEGTSRPGIYTASAQLNLPFRAGEQALRYTSLARLQRSESPLVPQDRFAIGGRYTVRGFDGESVLSGERGWLWRNDLGLALRETGAEAYVGVDVGLVSGRSTRGLLGRRLAGGVLGVRGSVGGLAYDVFVGTHLARPTGFASPDGLAGFSLNWAW